MEPWRRVWRLGFAPQLTEDALEALRHALVTDDQRLIQGETVLPPFYHGSGQPACGACVIGYCGWQGGEGPAKTVAEVGDYFGEVCSECDRLLGEIAASRYLTNWVDKTPRQQMRAALLDEVQRTITQRRIDGLKE